MEKKTKELIENLCVVAGAALMLYPIIDEAAKSIAPEIEKLTSGESDVQKLLQGVKEHEHNTHHEEPKHEQQQKPYQEHESHSDKEEPKPKESHTPEITKEQIEKIAEAIKSQ